MKMIKIHLTGGRVVEITAEEFEGIELDSLFAEVQDSLGAVHYIQVKHIIEIVKPK